MILTAIDIRTGKLDPEAKLERFAIQFDKVQLKIYSIIFNQDHIGEKPEEKIDIQTFLKSLRVGVIFTRAETVEKMHLLILILENKSSEDESGLLFKPENGDQDHQIDIHDVTK